MAYPLLAVAKEEPNFEQLRAALGTLDFIDVAPGKESLSIRILFSLYVTSPADGWAEVRHVLDVLAEQRFRVFDLHEGGTRLSRKALRARLEG